MELALLLANSTQRGQTQQEDYHHTYSLPSDCPMSVGDCVQSRCHVRLYSLASRLPTSSHFRKSQVFINLSIMLLSNYKV